MASETIHTLNDDNFEQTVTKATVPVLVDFWAEWCAPCRRLVPIIESVATEYAGRVVVGKLNVDENPGITTRFVIRSIPTLMLFKDGNIVESVVGLVDKEYLTRLIKKNL